MAKLSPGIHRTDLPRQIAGSHRWRNLAFLHWKLPEEVVRPLIPAPLELDLSDGEAWIGLVPFAMRNVRPWWSPAVPGISNFLETNLRTYVRFQGEFGVWFFSLEASKGLAVWLARNFWHLNYRWARMSLTASGERLQYRSERLFDRNITTQIDVQLQPEPTFTARAGSLEEFLVERYLLFSSDARGQIWRGEVEHSSYPLRRIEVLGCRESLFAAAGLTPGNAFPCHALFSPGVDVTVYRLNRVT